MAETHSLLQSIPNLRDVGAFINEREGSQRLKTGLLYRGARPDEASYQDRQRLLKDYKVKTIVDLRTKTEHIEQAQKRNAKISASAVVPQSNDDVAEPLKIPEITYAEINFNGSAFSKMLISKLSWVEFFWVIFYMAIGKRLEGIKMLAPYMEAAGLIGLAISSIDVCTKEVKQFFDVLADENNWPVLVHCTQGKDRTGLTVMLILFLLGVEVDAIQKDYLQSGPELEPEKADRVKEIASIGLSEHFANCPPELVGKVHEHLDNVYGGVENYLQAAGVTEDMQERVKRTLLS